MMRTPLLVSFATFALLEVAVTGIAQGTCNKQFVVSQVNLPTTTHLSSGDQGALRAQLIGACLDDRQVAQVDDHIRNVLRDLGYLGATVSESSMSTTDAGRQPQAASLNLNFEEGARYRVDEIEISGNRALEADQIRGVSPIQLGEFFDTKKIVETLDAVERLYEANGHPGMALHYQIVMKQGHGVCVKFTVMESAQSD